MHGTLGRETGGKEETDTHERKLVCKVCNFIDCKQNIPENVYIGNICSALT